MLVGEITRGEEFEAFLEFVENRSSHVVDDLIVNNVAAEGRIFTDLWKGYSNLIH